MKKILLVSMFAVVVLFSNCSKDTDDPITHINCDGLLTDTLGTNDNARIYMPNAFTPNNDGLNDISRPVTFNVSSLEFTIYDEQNAVVYTTNQLLQGWQSTVAASTSIKYYYKIQATTAANHHIGVCGELYKISCRPPGVTLYFEDQLTQFGFTGPTAENLATCP